MDKADCVVIGAGVIGLAVARALAAAGREVIVIESHAQIGRETSSRNSEVIHAGLYYPTGSLKARLCVTGRDLLYAYCADHGIAYRRCGKIIVATSDAQRLKLATLHTQAHANGCLEVSTLTTEEAQIMEPELACTAALYSPLTGIIDSYAYMLALHGEAEHAGALFAFDSRLYAGEANAHGVMLQVRTGLGTEIKLMANQVINCGGLWGPAIARTINGLDCNTIPAAWFAKGNYYTLAGKTPFSHLVYPIPENDGLGIHVTLDLGGQARFGPDVEWLENSGSEIDYTVDPRRAGSFYKGIRTYWPQLPDNALLPAYAGVRPKISPPGAASADFLFAAHDCPRYLGLYGIESPGLTASLAIAEHVLACLDLQ
ncbi:MAG TPA: NAD(P)/FAD-dependent oxidoreductase [Burkholderiaceae bacterium]|nr:NAD(P)/FAD-dependent oxidoreductase [Burkholderiaceae bacterium]